MLRVGVLVSGRGGNLRALLAAFPPGHPLVTIVCVASNRPECPAVAHAHAAGVPVYTADDAPRPRRLGRQTAMAAALRAAGADLLVLAGYDEILGPALLDPFAGRIINIHPSLLPAFAGTLHAPAEALAHGVKVTGCTVHFVTAAVDGGPIIAQTALPVLEDDSEERLAARIQEQEHLLLPRVIAWIAEGRLHLEGRRVRLQ